MKMLLLLFAIGMHPFWQETQRIKKFVVVEGVLATDGQTAWHFGGGNAESGDRARLVRKMVTVKDGKISDCNIVYPGKGFCRNIFFVKDSFMYLGGGLDSNIARYTEKDFWRYDMRSREWKQLRELSFYYQRKPSVLQNENGVFAVISELQADFKTSVCKVFRYDINADSWNEIPGTPQDASFGAAAFSIDNDIYIFCENEAMPINWKNSFYKLSTESNTWQKMADFPGQPRALCMAMSDGRFGYIGGGSGRAWGGFNDVYRYDPEQNSWRQMPSLPRSVHMGNAWRQDSTLYVGFGKAPNDNSTYIWKLAYK